MEIPIRSVRVNSDHPDAMQSAISKNLTAKVLVEAEKQCRENDAGSEYFVDLHRSAAV